MKEKIISFFKAILTFISILIYCDSFLNSKSYNVLFTIGFFLLWYLFYNHDLKEKNKDFKARKYSLLLSIIFSILLSIGRIGVYIYSEPINTFTFKNIFYVLLMMIGFIIMFFHLFIFLFEKIKNVSLISNHSKMKKRYFVLIFFVIFFSYAIYFVRFFPAIMTPDSYYVIHYANNFILSDFHTFGHTWFFGLPFHLFKILFSNLNLAVGFATIVQMVCISLAFSFVIRHLYNKGLSVKATVLLVIIYSLNPLYAHYSVTLWRDVMFGTAFAPLLICLFELISSKKLNKKYVVLFVITILTILFFRNNGIYVFIFIIPFILVFVKNHRLSMGILCGCILLFYIIIKGPVFDYFNVAKGKTVEAYSIPLQQMARVVALDKKIEKNDKQFLEKLWNYDEVATSYKSITSDPIKNLTDGDFLRENRVKFFKTYLHLMIQYPKIYVEAYLMETVGYWYPDVIYWATGGESKSFFETENVYSKPLTPKWYNNLIDLTTNRGLPLSNLLWSLGLALFILIISSFVVSYRNKKYILCYIPLYGLWLSIMLSTPVFCELRYVYGIFTCIPILLILPFIIKKKEIEKI